MSLSVAHSLYPLMNVQFTSVLHHHDHCLVYITIDNDIEHRMLTLNVVIIYMPLFLLLQGLLRILPL